jgi:hypothetical protein
MCGSLFHGQPSSSTTVKRGADFAQVAYNVEPAQASESRGPQAGHVVATTAGAVSTRTPQLNGYAFQQGPATLPASLQGSMQPPTGLQQAAPYIQQGIMNGGALTKDTFQARQPGGQAPSNTPVYDPPITRSTNGAAPGPNPFQLRTPQSPVPMTSPAAPLPQPDGYLQQGSSQPMASRPALQGGVTFTEAERGSMQQTVDNMLKEQQALQRDNALLRPPELGDGYKVDWKRGQNTVGAFNYDYQGRGPKRETMLELFEGDRVTKTSFRDGAKKIIEATKQGGSKTIQRMSLRMMEWLAPKARPGEMSADLGKFMGTVDKVPWNPAGSFQDFVKQKFWPSMPAKPDIGQTLAWGRRFFKTGGMIQAVRDGVQAYRDAAKPGQADPLGAVAAGVGAFAVAAGKRLAEFWMVGQVGRLFAMGIRNLSNRVGLIKVLGRAAFGSPAVQKAAMKVLAAAGRVVLGRLGGFILSRVLPRALPVLLRLIPMVGVAWTAWQAAELVDFLFFHSRGKQALDKWTGERMHDANEWLLKTAH